MSDVLPYWRFVRLDASGKLKSEELVPVKEFLEQSLSAAPDQDIQRQLLQIYRDPTAADWQLAELSLRCFVSGQIVQSCQRLTQQFGEGRFQLHELLPFVLDDTNWRKPLVDLSSDYQPLVVKLLQTFDPERSNLATWTRRLVERHPEVDRFLLQCGIYRKSDWSILKDTSPGSLNHQLGSLLPPDRLEQAGQLLKAFQTVYRADRLAQNQTGQKVTPPTDDQLQRIASLLPHRPSPFQLLDDLEALAKQLRQAKLQATEQLDEARADHQPAAATATAAPDLLLTTYFQMFCGCLDQAILQTLETRLKVHRQKKPPTDRQFLQALRLFYCDCQSMSDIAKQMPEFQKQYQITRLLKLKELYEDVRREMIALMLEQPQLRDQIGTDLNLARLASLDQRLEAALDQMIEAAKAEAASPNRTNDSLWSLRVCCCLGHHYPT